MAQPNPATAVSMAPLLAKLAYSDAEALKEIPADEIAAAVGLIFQNQASPVHTGCLLYAMHTTKLDHRPDILAACADAMRGAAAQVDSEELEKVIRQKGRPEGGYAGGLCDIVGTGGDGHSTYNVSTTASIISSALLLVAKHGNNASTSKSGSADLLLAASPAPVIASTTERTLTRIYSRTNYAFLYAREWHPGMKHAAPTRKELPFRTIFNLLGPLANPVHNTQLIETRILGVAKQFLGPVFSDALRLGEARKALVVCGAEDLDEVSCAGPTHCWFLKDSKAELETFTISPEDFGLKPVPLSAVAGGKSPLENAGILQRILTNEIDAKDPVLTFVMLNTAALLAVSGICESETSSMGQGDDGQVIKERGPGGFRWKEGVRRAQWCISSGAAKQQWDGFVKVTNEIAEGS